MISRKTGLVILALSIVLQSRLFSGEAGQNGMAFLKVDVDARAAGMAGAYSAVGENSSATYWNPAALALADNKSLVVMHHQSIADITQQFAAVQIRTGEHALALSFNLMTNPNIEIREEASSEPIGITEAINFSSGISYAHSFKGDWHVGITVKYLFEKYYLKSAGGWALDLGTRKSLSEALSWGFVIQNLGAMAKLDKESTPLPLMFRTGVAYRAPFEIIGNKPLLSTDIQYINKEQFLVRAGSQVDLGEYIAVRLGGIFGELETHFTTGLSLKYKSYSLDYAFVPYESIFGNSHRVSFAMFF
ncbi:MAG: PorV/PorQ family protein [Calditrichaceae bacterium]|nr:PorV/PorQ family protein [Calditrichaceae bacterium]MBN2710052.1 PorV/PorQ family protein [Calditrichaceae bacterium]